MAFCKECGRNTPIGHTLACSQHPANLKLKESHITVHFRANEQEIDEMRKELRRKHGIKLQNRFRILREYILRNSPEEVIKHVTVG